MGLGMIIAKHLKEQERSVAWLARKTGVPATTLRSMIAHDSNKVDVCDLLRISAFFGGSPQALVWEVYNEERRAKGEGVLPYNVPSAIECVKAR